MEFVKNNEYWSYQYPEWDNFMYEDIDDELSKLTQIEIKSFALLPEADVWIVLYKDEEFTIINDLVYGCEIRVHDEMNIPLAQSLVRYIAKNA